MATRLSFRLIFSHCAKRSIISSLHKNLHTKVPTREIKIPVKYGYISAKLWGNNERRPILAIHGWQDNAGTWSTLAPMIIDKDRSILAIDLPGHGLSSWIPPDMLYYSWDIPRNILYLKKYFKWDKVSLLCHSMGAIARMRYTSLYPNDVDFYIAFDSFVLDAYNANMIVDKYPNWMEKGLIAEDHLDQQPPLYTMDEITKMWHIGSYKSVALDKVQYLAERGVKQSKQDPTKYYFSRDFRLKYGLFIPESKEFVTGLVKRLKSPTLYFKAIDSKFSADKFAVEMRDIVAKNNENFQMHFVPGTHHVHLNNPENVAPLILNFLKKYA